MSFLYIFDQKLISEVSSKFNKYFLGTNQSVHSTLSDLVCHYQTNPITLKGGEVLLEPVGQDKTPPDYEELFQPFENFDKQNEGN